MFEKKYPFFLANQAKFSDDFLEVKNKYSGEVVTQVSLASGEVIDQAIAAAKKAFDVMRRMPAFKRKEILNHCVKRIEERKEELAKVLAVEAGKALQHSRLEVIRCLDTFRIAAEESVRLYGEYQPLEISPYAEGYEAIWKPVPIGPCSFIDVLTLIELYEKGMITKEQFLHEKELALRESDEVKLAKPSYHIPPATLAIQEPQATIPPVAYEKSGDALMDVLTLMELYNYRKITKEQFNHEKELALQGPINE